MDLEIKSKIISYLRNTESASASDIAKQINHNRITVGKYLQILEAQKLVISKRIASALYWQLAESSSKSRILIVDDEKHIVDLIRLSLSNNYDIYEAYNGKEAIEIATSVLPSVIILDIMMPIKDGFEVLDYLKKNVLTQKIPTIMLSAKSDVKAKVKAIELGAEDYIVKPFDPLELEARIAGLVRRLNFYNTKNSITNLPNRIITEEMRNSWKQKKYWYETKIKINNFNEYINEFGHKKGFEVIKLVSRMLLEKIQKEDYLGHLDDTKFIIFSDNKIKTKDVELNFKNMQPFFYTNHKSENIINITCEEKYNA
jgi:PleD family two-component response regulator